MLGEAPYDEGWDFLQLNCGAFQHYRSNMNPSVESLHGSKGLAGIKPMHELEWIR
jgi:hypothetical protein